MEQKVSLRSLEGYKPLASPNNLARYILEKGPGTSGVDAVASILFGETATDQQLIDRTNRNLQAQDDVAGYVAELTQQLKDAGVGYRPTERGGLPHTHLTNLFSEQYNAPMDSLTQAGVRLTLSAALFAERDGGGFLLDYFADTAPPQTFIHLETGARGFVNGFFKSPSPLVGEGNIAFINGVEEALRADIGLVLGAELT
jgi:hypothetical protein